jgi:hypothetical protein
MDALLLNAKYDFRPNNKSLYKGQFFDGEEKISFTVFNAYADELC